jgi:hypothetical protein
MKSLPHTPELLRAAKRIVWFKPPEEALDNPVELLAYAMTGATDEDMALLLDHVGMTGLREAIDNAPPGIIDARSWSVDQRAALARDRLAAVAPGWMGTLLGLALSSAGEQFMDDSAKEKPASRRELVVITDLQEGAKLDGLQGHEWPSGVKAMACGP